MKSYREMRQEAWNVATTNWSFRMLATFFVFAVIGGAVFGLLQHFFASNDIHTWREFLKSCDEARAAGIDMTVPSTHQAMSMTWASGFSKFLELLFQSMFIFGLISVALRAIRNQSEGWFGSAFGGFRNPLGMMWLNILMSLRIFLWSLLLIIPGIIAAFRYSLAWYVKAEHPDYSAAKCLAESGRLMRGHKCQLFVFGFSYIGWILLAVLAMTVSGALSAALPVAGLVAIPLAMVFFGFVIVYIIFGQAAFYQEMKRLDGNSEAEVIL